MSLPNLSRKALYFRLITLLLTLGVLSLNASAQELCSRALSAASDTSIAAFLAESKINRDRSFQNLSGIESYFSFPDQNLRLVTRYTGSLYTELNAALSKKEGLRETKYLRLMDRLNSALSWLPWFEGTTYSGAAMKTETFHQMNLQVGKVFSFEFYFSTTKKKSTADGFIKRGLEKGNQDRIPILYIVNGKNGRNVVDLSFYDEAEILFRPETKFRVTQIKPLLRSKQRGYSVYLEEVYQKLPSLEPLPKNFSFLGRSQFIEAQRLYDKKDWIDAIQERPTDPWNYYGKEAYENWKAADVYLKGLPQDTKLTWDLFEQVHAIAMNGHPYKGLQRRNVREQFRKNKLTEEKATDLIQRIENGETVIRLSKIALREKTKDFFTHSGDNLDSSGQRYFNKKELELFQRNLFFSVDQKSVHKVGEDAYLAEAHYIYPENIKKVLETVFEESKAMMDGARTQEEFLWAVVKFQYALLSIHPFSDGNGRVIRLVTDWLLRKEGFSVPLWPITNELNLTIEEYYSAMVESMNAYTAHSY